LAQRGNVLIKGWGAATLLRDMPQVISARVCAPMEFRVRVMMERLGRKDAGAVREEIERFDAARAAPCAPISMSSRRTHGSITSC